MKTLYILLFLFPFVANAQAFHFEEVLTTLNKDVSQSPAHWYIEVFSDVNVDTTLRWKANLQNLPAAWTINFDDQNNNHIDVQHNDSADFTLFENPTFPQKLIIGCAFNGVAGTGSAYFDIYDPANPTHVITIEYKFVVTQTVGVSEAVANKLVHQKGDFITFDQSLVNKEFTIYSNSGQKVLTSTIKSNYSLNLSHLASGVYIIHLEIEDAILTKRVLIP